MIIYLVDKRKEETLNNLILISKRLNKNLGRRDISYKLYYNCCNDFNLFNEAKIAAGLKISRRKCLPISEESEKFTLELVRIVAYITGDGHLNKDLKGFFYSSKDINSLKDFEFCVKKQFNFSTSKIKNRDKYHYGEITLYLYFNTTIARFLYSIGTPKGDKVANAFNIPDWIKNNKRFIREYLKILFYCEGSKYIDNKRDRIQINMRKIDDLKEEGIIFMSSIKDVLKNEFNIETGKVRISKGTKRINKDDKETNDFRIEIKKAFVDKFEKEIGWIK